MAYTDVNLEPVVFQAVATDAGENYIINPFDINGNVIESINVTVDTTNAGAAVTLPLISSLNPSTNLVITVIGSTLGSSGNGLEVVASAPDTICGQPLYYVPSFDNANLTFRVAGANSWAQYTALPFLP